LETLCLPVNVPCVAVQRIEHIKSEDGELSRRSSGLMAAGCRYCCEYCYRAKETFLNVKTIKVTSIFSGKNYCFFFVEYSGNCFLEIVNDFFSIFFWLKVSRFAILKIQ
jgi:hypothetical protein